MRLLQFKSIGVVLLAATCLAQSSCLKSKSAAKAAAAADNLTLTGSVSNQAGAPAANVSVFIETDASPAATTAADGTYSIALDSGTLLRLSGSSTNPRNSFFLYFALASDATQQTLSTPVDLSARGTKAVPGVVLAQVASLKGTLLQVIDGKQPAPAAQVVVSAGRSTATTGDDGSFQLNQVPAGSVLIKASAPLTAPLSQSVTLKAGEAKVATVPFVLFPATGVYGIVVLDQKTPIADLVQQGHPFLRTFSTVGSQAAAFVRYATDQAQLGTAAWHALSGSFDFDFPKDGGNVLYYQFADSAQQHPSPVQQLAVVLDQFKDSTGFVIEDGSGIVNSRTAVLHVDVPAAAFRMRFAENTNDLSTAAWLLPNATTSWVFNLTRDPVTGVPQGFGQRTIYMQFQDASGLLSPTFQQTTTFQIFPGADSTGIFTLNDGADVLTSRLVQMKINVPTNAYEMLIYEAEITSNVNVIFPAPTDSTAPATRNSWLVVQPTSFFTFTSLGRKTVYLQFRTIDLAVSPLYKQTVDVIPFPTDVGGFTVNGGAVNTLSPLVNIDLKIPPNAIGFRIFETSTVLSSTVPIGAWLTPVPSFNYHISGSGNLVLYVQYEDSNFDTSPAYQQPVQVLPDPVGTGALLINPDANGVSQVQTANAQVLLSITAPPAFGQGQATMTIWDCPFLINNYTVTATATSTTSTPTGCTEANAPQIAANLPYQTTYPWTLTGSGSHSIYVNFYNPADNTTSATRSQVIFYQPFPAGAQGVAINGGAQSVSAANATSSTLTLTSLANVKGVRLANDTTTTLASLPFLDFTPTISNYALPTTVGIHTVYAQYLSTTGDISPVYTTTIAVTP